VHDVPIISFLLAPFYWIECKKASPKISLIFSVILFSTIFD